MQAITIHDKEDHGVLALDLIDIIRVISTYIENYEWCISNVWCITKNGEEVPEFSEPTGIPQLTKFAEDCIQIIDGEFIGIDKYTKVKSVVIVAADSTYWVVLSDHEYILQQIDRAFIDVRGSDEWSANYA